MGRFINPFTDWGFKRIFGQEVSKDILITFLNALLEGEHVIADLTFADKELLPSAKDQRGIIYDIHCTTDSGEHIIVEMQNRDQQNFVERTIYYVARALSSQAIKGESWKFRIDAVYGVFFMNFRSYQLGDDKLRTDVLLADRDTHRQLTDKVRLIYLQLPFFNKEEDECTSLFDCFIYTLKNMEILDRMPFLARNAVFKKLAEIADVRALTREETEKYDDAIQEMRNAMSLYERAINEGKEEGIGIGMAKGKALIVRKLLLAGYAPEQLAKDLDLDPAEVRKLQN